MTRDVYRLVCSRRKILRIVVVIISRCVVSEEFQQNVSLGGLPSRRPRPVDY